MENGESNLINKKTDEFYYINCTLGQCGLNQELETYLFFEFNK